MHNDSIQSTLCATVGNLEENSSEKKKEKIETIYFENLEISVKK